MKRYFSTAVAICLGGIALAVFSFLLTTKAGASHAPPVQEAPAQTPDLIIDVRAGDETVMVNEVISYMLLYTNTLGSPLSDVIISSTLSADQYYTPAIYLSNPIIPTTSFTYTGSFWGGYTLEWQLGTLAASASGWIVVTTTVPPEAEPPWSDNDQWPLLGMSAVITTSTPGVSTGNPQGEEGDSVSVMVVGPVLRLDKSDDPDPVRPGRLLTYTLILENKDREDAITANNIVITDVLPDNTIFHSASASGYYSPTSPSSGLIIWHPPDPLAPASTLEVTFTVRLTESMPSCPPDSIRNYKDDYSASSDETIQLVAGYRNLATPVDDVLEKVIKTPPIPSGSDDVFPGGFVTYTISIYNPRHDQLVSGLRLTDTLPGQPDVFAFIEMLTGTTPITTHPEVVWENLSVDAGGITELAFRAQVPYNIHIDPNQVHKVYKNNLSASVSDLVICDMKDQVPSQADVRCQVCLNKSVEPNHVLSGELVTYTITMENTGDTMISNIRLTDTLPGIDPADFSYVDMVYGPAPADVYTNAVVWDGLSVDAYTTEEIIFRARAIGWPEAQYGNYLSASSPETSIPDRSNIAKVEIDPPFTLGKTVDPTETFVEQNVAYTITVCNVSSDTYTIDRIIDLLPAGFYVDGANPMDEVLSPPVVIGPDECWNYPFEAFVSYDVGCANLPGTFENETGNVGIHLEGDPPDLWWTNSVDLAPLLVNPQIMIDKEANHTYVMPGETFVYTITLINGSNSDVNPVTIIDTLPGSDPYFEYVEMVAGPAPSNVTAPNITWSGRTVPAQGQLVLAFRVLVPGNMPLGQYRNTVQASTTAYPVCVEEIDPTAQVRVVEEVIELNKYATPDETPPLGIVQYDIRMKNLDSVPVTGVVVTETLPSALGEGFEFVGMTSGDLEPDEVNGRQVIWRDLTIVGGQTFRLRFNARAPILFGTYNNDVDAWCPRSDTIEPEYVSDIAAPVDVLPGVVLYKTVYPTYTLAGGTVVYTITLFNQPNTALEDVRITDTLPSGFSYGHMLSGDPPVQISPKVVWDVGQVPKNSTEEIVFEVKVGIDVITGTYYNAVNGYSPSALIPGAENAAPVQVEPVDILSVYLPLILRNR